MARRRRKVGILATLLRALKARRRRQATARRVAQRKAVAAQKVIQRDSRTTAGELRASGTLEWNAQGMPDSTVMVPVIERGRHTGEWVPAKTQPGIRGGSPRSGKTVAQPPVIAGMKMVRVGRHWYYEPIVINQDGSPLDTQQSQKCGAPTKDKTPCERLGDCPIRAHQTWRKAHSR